MSRSIWKGAVSRCALVLALGAVFFGGCKCAKDAAKKTVDKTGALRDRLPPELQTEIGVGSPLALLDEVLALVRQFVPLPVQREMLVGLALQRAQLPSELSGALDLERPVWLLGLDGDKLKEETPSLVALPIRSKAALQSALGVQMKRSGDDGPLILYTPKPTSPQLSSLKLWLAEKYAVITSSRSAFAAVSEYLSKRLLTRKAHHDLQVRVIRQNISEAQVQHTLQKLRRTAKRSAGSSASAAKLEGAISGLLLRYSELLTTTPLLELHADLKGTNLSINGRAESAPKSDLARAIKRQKTGQPFASALIPAQTWAVIAAHDFPGSEKASLLGGLLHQLAEFFPAPQRERLVKALSAAAEHLGGSLTLALHRAVDGGLGGLIVTRVAEREKARAAVEKAASVLTQWANQQVAAGGRTAKILRTQVACGDSKAQVLQLPFLDRASTPTASIRRRLLGDTLGLGWVFQRDIGVFALGRDVDKQLVLSCTKIKAGTASPFTERSQFKQALASPDTRSGVFYLSVVDFVRMLEGRGFDELAPLLSAARDKHPKRAFSANWGVDDQRRAFTGNVELPLANLLLFKPLLGALGASGGPGAMPGFGPGGF